MMVAARRERSVSIALVACAALVALWLVAAERSRRAPEAFALTAERFRGVTLDTPAWRARMLPIRPDPLEPNILVAELTLRAPSNAVGSRPVLARLVHGYNMCDCMRIKGYRVALLADTRPDATASAPAVTGVPPGVQVWSVTSSLGDRSIWVTSLLRASDLAATAIDIRDMPFPRVGTPDDLGWAPQGLRWSSLRHPLRNARVALRSRWNASRCDWATFLRLKQPAWASAAVLSLVSASRGASVSEPEMAETVRQVAASHLAVADALRRTAAANVAGQAPRSRAAGE